MTGLPRTGLPRIIIVAGGRNAQTLDLKAPTDRTMPE